LRNYVISLDFVSTARKDCERIPYFLLLKKIKVMKNKKLVVVKQVVGIDIGMKSFYSCYKVQFDDKSTVISVSKKTCNNL
jgi:hypothetical protein